MAEGLLAGVDRDLVQPLQRRIEKLFAAVHLRTKVTGLRETGDRIEATLEGQGPQTFDRVLVAVGRRARSGGLRLEATRVQLTDRGGFVQIDDHGRTDDPHVYAACDVTFEPMLAHRAMPHCKRAS